MGKTKKELVATIATFGVAALQLPENTEVNNDVLEGIVELAKSYEATIEELNELNTQLSEENARLKQGGKAAALPRVKVGKLEHVFTAPKFQLPKDEVRLAEDVAKSEDAELLKECVKRGVLVPVEKED